MISVPTSTGSQPSAPQAPPVADVYLMMAAAQMHKEGRLVQSQYGEPDTTGAPSGDKSTPPQEYFPSDGRRDKPAMMTQNDELKGDFTKGNDTGYEAAPPYADSSDQTMRIQRRKSVDTYPSMLDSKSKSFNTDMNSFIKDNKLQPGDVVKDKSGTHWMFTPDPGTGPQFQEVRPKGSKDLIS